MPLLADFADALGLPSPPMIVDDPQRYVPAIDGYLAGQLIAPDDRVWLGARLGHFIAAVLIQRFGGAWLLDDDLGSPTVGRYVVGQFAPPVAPARRIDAVAAAFAYMDEPPGRALAARLRALEEELRRG